MDCGMNKKTDKQAGTESLAKTKFFPQSKTLAIGGWVVVVAMVENNAFSGPNPQVFPTGPSVAIT